MVIINNCSYTVSMASGDNHDGERAAESTESLQHHMVIPYVVNVDNYLHQLKRFSSNLIAHCTVYNDICNKLLKKILKTDQLARYRPHLVGGLCNDLKAMNVMFGMMKMFCEQIVQVSTPDPGCLPTLKKYFSQTVEFTREVWRKILTCKELRLALAKEFSDKGMMEVLQRMVAYVRGEDIQTNATDSVIFTTRDWHDLSTSNYSEVLTEATSKGGPLDNDKLPDLFTIEELEQARNYDEDDNIWSTLVTSGLGILKCIAVIGGAAILGAAAGMILGAVVASVGGPLGMAVGIGVGLKIGATIGAGLGAIHKTFTMDKDI